MIQTTAMYSYTFEITDEQGDYLLNPEEVDLDLLNNCCLGLDFAIYPNEFFSGFFEYKHQAENSLRIINRILAKKGLL